MSQDDADDAGNAPATPHVPSSRGAVDDLTDAGREHFQAGRLREAAEILEQVLHIAPQNLDALRLTGLIGYRCQAYGIAAERLYRALMIGPRTAEAHFGLAAALEKLGRLDEAAVQYYNALRVRPVFPEASANLGMVLYRLGRPDEAIENLRASLRQRPDSPETLSNLGLMLYETGRTDEAADSYTEALRLNPGMAEAITNLGNILQERGQLDEALSCQRRALCVEPGLANALVNLGGNLVERGRAREALACFVRAQGADPFSSVGGWNEGMCRLALGDLETGWEQYERRWDMSTGFARSMVQRRSFRQPLWDGVSDITGKRLLLWREQGIGDEIMFASCFASLANSGAQVTYEGSPKLRALFARSFPHMRITVEDTGSDGTRDDFDLHLPIGSLPRLFRRTFADFPADGGFLKPDSNRVAFWRERLNALGPGPYVGLCWRGLPRLQSRRHQYSHIEDWEPVLRIPGPTFVNMQYDGAAEETAYARDAFGATIHTFADLDVWNDLDDVAALTGALDIQFSVMTAVAQMAGAVGVPTRLLMVRNGVWMCLNTDGLPWYPSVRVVPRGFEQPWRTATRQLAAELEAMKG